MSIAMSLAGATHGATITSDGVDCTLDEAIAVANSNMDANGCTLTGSNDMTSIDFLDPVGSINGDVIVMAPANQNVTLSSSLPNITTVVSIQGNGAIIDGNDSHQPFIVFPGGALKLDSVTVANGTVVGSGGGLINSGTATISNSTFSENTATFGGGLLSTGTVTISSSTFSGNFAVNGGGGLRISDTATINNSTFSGNSTNTAGGGIFNTGTITISNTTFSGNSGGSAGGLANADMATISNSVLANSVSGADCDGSSNPTFTDSLIEDGSCSPGAGNLTMMDPVLGPLADNGGPTQTHEPQAGSPLIDAVASSMGACAGSTTDQRGSPRPFDRVVGQMPETDCDIGAVENQADDAVPVDLESFSVD